MPTELRKLRDQQRTERSRQALIDAATKVFVRQGYHKTLVSDIVAEAKMGQGTFYRHFADKRAVFETIFDQFIERLISQFSEMTTNPPNSFDEYRMASIEAYKAMATFIEARRELAILLLRESPTIDEDFRSKVTELFQVLKELAASFLDDSVRRGFSRPCRTDVVAEAIVGMVVWMIEAWWGGRITDLSQSELIVEIVDFAFKGLKNA